MKIIPSDTEAEQSVLGACLIDENSITKAEEILVKEDFYREDNKIIFECISNMYARNMPVDIITIKSELEQTGKLDAVGGINYIAKLPEKVPTTANVEKYIDIIKEKAIRRNLIQMTNEIAEKCYDPLRIGNNY